MPAGRRPSRSNLELRHLRYFLATAEELNYGRAAERLGIAQPGLSQQIRVLEEIVGTTLFDRSRRSVELTLAGELFVVEARKVLDQAERAKLAAQRAGRGEVGHLAIGYTGSAAYTGILTTLVGGFRQEFPDVQLAISEMEMMPQLEHLKEGKLDICFVRPPVPLPAGVATIPVLYEPLMVALPDNHPMAGSESIDLATMASDIFITPRHPPGVSFHKHTTQACQAAGIFPQFGPQGRDFVTITSMVSVGLGIALVPASVCCIQLPHIRYRRIAGPSVKAELAVAFRRNDRSAVARAFARHARRYAALPDASGAPEGAQAD